MLAGERIRSRREHAGYSLRKIASDCGISPSHLSDIERGNRYLTEPLAMKIAKKLDMEIDFLLFSAGIVPKAYIEHLLSDFRVYNKTLKGHFKEA